MEQKRLTFDSCKKYLRDEIFRTERSGDVNKVGIEMEMFPLKSSKKGDSISLIPCSYEDLNSSLKSFVHEYKLLPIAEDDGSGCSSASKYMRDKYNFLSFEPGGQLEYSSPPVSDLEHLVEDIQRTKKALRTYLDRNNICLVQMGTNPWHTVEQIGLQMKKSRYYCMDRYFKAPFGRQMMRQTSTIQVCLDFASEEELSVKRYLAACFLSPFASGIFANSPFVGGLRSDHKSYRVYLWNHLDSSRTGYPSLGKIIKNRSFNACADAYFDFLLNSKVIYIVRNKKYIEPSYDLTFREWVKSGYEGYYPILSDLIDCLSLLFPEVRPRGFLELRSIDMQAEEWQMVPIVFYVGLLYDQKNLDFICKSYERDENELNDLRIKSSMGLLDKHIRRSAQSLMKMAIDGYERVSRNLGGRSLLDLASKFNRKYTLQGLVPADSILASCKKSNPKVSAENFCNELI